MSSIRSGLLSRRVVCSLPQYQLERQFSLLRVSAGVSNSIRDRNINGRILPQTTRNNSTFSSPGNAGSTGPNNIASTTDVLAVTGFENEGAAADDNVDSSDGALLTRLTGYARPVPASPSYFSRQPNFNDSFLRLQTLFRLYGHLPLVPADQVERVAWRSLRDYRHNSGEEIKAPQYNKCIAIVKHLNKIHPSLKPVGVAEVLNEFKREVNPFDNVAKQLTIDRFGRAVGVGRRKTSVARAWVVEGTGEIQVNGKSLSEAFGRVHDRESAAWALRATNRMDKYNVWALADGGGTTGQAEALTLAVAKALVAHEPALKTALRKAGCIARDPRMVERKKHGHVKARKMPAWVKR